MTRYKAAGIHLILSGLVLFAIYLFIAFVWYPHKLFALGAGLDLLRLIICVDLIVGPLVMLIVFDAKKRLIKLDITIILVCQICFMSYGLWTMLSARPAFFVFSDSHFYLVRANEIDSKDLKAAANDQFNHAPLLGPIYVGAIEPDDGKIKNDLTFASLGGMGVQNFPKYYVSYQQVISDVLKSGKTLKQLGVDSDTKQRIKEYEQQHATRPVLYLPMVNKLTPLIVVIDAKTAEVIDLI